MAKRNDIQTILILGAGPIVIGQACEFDYSGTQACKALKEEGYRVILVNSNPATIMTDPNLADATYIEPIEWEVVRKIIEKERPDAILPTMGGQTALNCALELEKQGVLAHFNVEMIGANADAIDKAENRQRFDIAMKKIGLQTARSGIANNMEEAFAIASELGFPCVIRPSFTMGGTGGGIAYDLETFEAICLSGLDLSPTHSLLIDESLIGWKEYEMEVVRDKRDNCIIICSIENFDPMGIHTGDSITVAPAQTLTDRDFQKMRNASFAILREIGVETGGSNVQFAINPKDGRMIVIEMNPRVSRSSALASKATGFPIAKIAAKLAVGYTLDELDNDITGGKTPASFEPTIDYVVTKIPRFNFEKFELANDRLTTQMKSVGESMALGQNFKSSLQKALRSLETGVSGLDGILTCEQTLDVENIKSELQAAGPNRIFYLAEAIRLGMSLDAIHKLTHIDRWFLTEVAEIVAMEALIKSRPLSQYDALLMKQLKRAGFADSYIAKLLKVDENKVRAKRLELNVQPVFKRVDTSAGEFQTDTAYLYSTYEQACEAYVTHNPKKVIILGGGPNRIGQGIEFDYCCVHAAIALREQGYETIMINCNPETVSTDFDTADRLYFEPVTLEHVLDIVELEKPLGVIVQYGGQTPLKLAKALKQAGVIILGTQPEDIDAAEDRALFSNIVKKLGLLQPANSTALNLNEALSIAPKIGYPLVVRPSFVLGGRAMEIVHSESELRDYFHHSVISDNTSPILLDKFLDDAVEVDVDAISDGDHVLIGGIMQHIEQAGIHSGDSACSLPPYSISQSMQNQLREQTIALAKALNVIGLMNIQFAIANETLYLIEVNPRAARTVPFVSKATGIALAKIAAKVMLGQSLSSLGHIKEVIPSYFSVKEVVFPFNKFLGVDPILGPEMRSTGEVMGFGDSFSHAFAKAMLAANPLDSLFKTNLDKQKRVLISIKDSDKKYLGLLAKQLIELGFTIEATAGTAKALNEMGFNTTRVNKLAEGKIHVIDKIRNGEYIYIINTSSGRAQVADSSLIRQSALQHHVHYDTTINAAFATLQALKTNPREQVKSVQSLHQRVQL
ncbi:carbamoyl-phosphate synthase large subunit [Thorsellia anophelis]|uniref:Carbamoyl phosphate synthase large chain n=1 Tax=Thorsellia anophelis DSM 18579 TaxID=1123402 RepID=A0A1I0A057_9GAMM|nr:carbamoyl-phosphate synthase large subunit [Thorsellia anophelis]SES86557.1 carbamoyl-phosphate synthase large subunit [Thorsellia anophelis DSM 18579]